MFYTLRCNLKMPEMQIIILKKELASAREMIVQKISKMPPAFSLLKNSLNNFVSFTELKNGCKAKMH